MSDLGHQTSEELDRWLVELAYGEASSVPAEARARIESDPQLSSELAALREARSLAAMPLEEPSGAMDDAILAAADDFLATLSDAPSTPDAIDATPSALPPPIDLAAERAARRAAPAGGASPAPSDSKLLAPAPPAWMRFIRPLSLAASIAVVVGGSWMLLQNRETAMDRAPAALEAAPVPSPVATVPASPLAEDRAAEEKAKRSALAAEADLAKKAAEPEQKKEQFDAVFKSAMAAGEAGSGALEGVGRGGGGIGGLGLSGAGTGGGAGYGTGSIGSVEKQAAAKKDVAIQAPAKPVAPEVLAADKDAYVSRGASPDDEAVDEAKFRTMREEAPSAAPPPPPAPTPTATPRGPVAPLADAPVPVNQAPPTLQPAPREALSDRLKVVTRSALESPKPAAASAAVESRDATVVTQASASALIATGRSHLLERRYTQAVGAFRSARKSLESQANFASDTLWQDAAAGEIDGLLALGYDAEADRLAEQLARVAPDRVNLQRGVRRSRQYDFNEGSGNSAPATDAPLTK